MASEGLFGSLGPSIAFEPVDSHHYIEISETESGINLINETKTDWDIVNLCASPSSSSDVKWITRILFTRMQTHGFNKVPYSKDALNALQKHWHMPDVCFLTYHMDRAMPFSPVYGDSYWEGTCLISNFCGCDLIMSHNENTHSIFVVIYGIYARIFEDFIAIQTIQNFAYQPQLLPFLFAKWYTSRIVDFISKVWNECKSIQKALNCEGYFLPGSTTHKAPDITDMPRKLTALTTAIAGTTLASHHLGQIVISVESMVGKHQKLGPVDIVAEMQDHICLMHRQWKHTRLRLEELEKSAQAMVQMVYAMLQQRDNEINHRYGADMRVITAITLVFLPGTFVATFFSTSFWDFAPSNTGSKVSGWVWLYWVATIVLTLIVLSIWRGITVLKQFRSTVMQLWRKRLWRNKKADEEIGKKQ